MPPARITENRDPIMHLNHVRATQVHKTRAFGVGDVYSSRLDDEQHESVADGSHCQFGALQKKNITSETINKIIPNLIPF